MLYLCILLLGLVSKGWGFSSGVSTPHECVHDKFFKEHEHTHVHHPPHPTAKYQAASKQSTWADLRITVDYSYFTDNGPFGAFIKNSVVPNAIKILSPTLRVRPVQGNLFLHLQCYRYYVNPYKCIEYFPAKCATVPIPDKHLAEKNGTGIPNTDFIIYAQSNAIGGKVRAVATACQFESQGRPVAGYANFGPVTDVNFNDPTVIEDWVAVVVHEFMHALGFSGGVWKNLFKDPVTGKPYVPIANFTERGEKVVKFTSPNTLQKGKEFFGCGALNGVEIESSGGEGSAGSHLEMRVLGDAVMTAASGSTGFVALSPVELAVFEDSGWYKPDYTRAGRNFWGKNAGCIFPLERCLNGTKTNPYPINNQYYCTDKHFGCTIGRTRKGLCDVVGYNQALPTEFQYFANPNLGGRSNFLDFCPYYVPVSTMNCISAADQPKVNYWGEMYGSHSSRCLPSSLQDNSFTRYYVNPGSGCYVITCGAKPSYDVSVNGVKQTCVRPAQTLMWNGFRGNVTCVPWDEVC